MRKTIVCILTLALLSVTLGACGQRDKENTEKMQIVSTIFSSYDWTRAILGEKVADAQLTLLVKNGVDLHSYQPSVEDILTISNCDVFIYVGGESDAWVKDVLRTNDNPDRIEIDLLQVLGESREETDEHVWLSLKNAKKLCAHITDQLTRLNPKAAKVYENNLNAYTNKLDALDEEYREAVEAAKHNTLIFGDRFPFRYLFEEYGLEYYAAFSGCSAESEVSFDTTIFLAEKLDELGLSSILVTEASDQSLAETIVQSTKEKNQGISVLNSIQSVTGDQIENGVTYLSIMENNLAVLQSALQ